MAEEEQQRRNEKGQFLSFKDTRLLIAKEITAQKDKIEGGQKSLKLATMLSDDRKTRSGSDLTGNKGADMSKQFATLNNTFSILSKTLGDYKSIGQTQIDVVSELKDITEKAEYASAKDQKDLLREVNTQIKILKEVEKQTDPDESPVLAEALKTQKLLKKNSGIMDQMNQGLSSVLVKGLGALAGAFGDSPLLAMGAQFVGNKITERGERKREEKGKIRTAIRKKQDIEQDDLVSKISPAGDDPIDNVVDKVVKEKAKETGMSPEILRESVYLGVNEGMKDALAEAIEAEEDDEIKRELEGIFDSLVGSGGVVDAVNRVEARMDEANAEAIRQFNRNKRNAIEARRDGKASILRPKDGFGSEDNKVKKKLGGFLQALKDRFVITAMGLFTMIGTALKFIGAGIKAIFSTKAMGFLLKKALPIAAIGYALFKGGQAAIEEYKKSGDIMEATGTFFGQIAETLTFGLLSKDKLKEWGSSFGLWIEDKIIEWTGDLKGILSGPLDKIRMLADEIASWFDWLADLDIRDFIPDKMVSILESTGIIDTKQEKQQKALAKQFDAEAEEGIRARATAAGGLTDDDTDFLIEQNAEQVEIEAKNAEITVVQYKALKQQQALDARENAPDNVVDINTPMQAREAVQQPVESVTEVVEKTSNKITELKTAENEKVITEIKAGNEQIKKLKAVEAQTNEIETSKIRRAEALHRKAQQPRMIQQNSSTTNNQQTNIMSGGPSDDDNMYNRSENQQRVG